MLSRRSVTGQGDASEGAREGGSVIGNSGLQSIFLALSTNGQTFITLCLIHN